jgi:hypothetical protein
MPSFTPAVPESNYLPHPPVAAPIIRSCGNLRTADPLVDGRNVFKFLETSVSLRSSLHRSRCRPTVCKGDTRLFCAMVAWFSNDVEDGYERTRYRCNSDDRMFAAGTCIRKYLYDHRPEQHSCLSGGSQSPVSEYPNRAVWSCPRLRFGLLGHQQMPVCLDRPRKADPSPCTDSDASRASSCVPGCLRIHVGLGIRDATGRLSTRMCAKPPVCRFRAMSAMSPPASNAGQMAESAGSIPAAIPIAESLHKL